ncbi:MAG: biotin transporter BioY [Flammeovirgaceae bacterium]
MKDIRLLGDIVKLKLAELHIPIQIYIGIENVLLLIFAAKLTYVIPVFGYLDNFQPLVIVMIGVVYGYQASLRGIALYLILGMLGVPVFESTEAGLTFILASNKIGIFLAYFLASVVAATLSTYHWDRHLWTALLLFFLCLSVIHVLGQIVTYNHPPFSPEFMSYSLVSISIKTLIGATFINACWHLSYAVFPELRE